MYNTDYTFRAFRGLHDFTPREGFYEQGFHVILGCTRIYPIHIISWLLRVLRVVIEVVFDICVSGRYPTVVSKAYVQDQRCLSKTHTDG